MQITFKLYSYQYEKIMAALQDLNSAILNLTSVVAQSIPDITPPVSGAGATEAQVAAAAAAVNAQTTLLQNAISAVTPPAIPAVPTGLTATVTSPGSVNLAFAASPGAVSYNVKQSPTSGQESTVRSVTTNSAAFTGLSVGTPLFFVVSAVNAGGESANSAEVTATP